MYFNLKMGLAYRVLEKVGSIPKYEEVKIPNLDHLHTESLTEDKILEIINHISAYSSLTSNFSKSEFIRQTLHEPSIKHVFENLWKYHGNTNFTNFVLCGNLIKVDKSVMKHS